MKPTSPATITRAYHCTSPHSSKRIGYDATRARIAGPLTPTPSMIHLSHQAEIAPVSRVIQPAPFTVPSMIVLSNFDDTSPSPSTPSRASPTLARPVKTQSYISSTYHLRKSVL